MTRSQNVHPLGHAHLKRESELQHADSGKSLESQLSHRLSKYWSSECIAS